MSEVFARYPAGGGELVLALALADHAHDDGRKVFPFVANLAAKTRQSERTVQAQLQRMLASGWLVLVGRGDGGRGKPREYRISAEWLAGGNLPGRAEGPPDDGIGGAEPAAKGADSSPFVGRKGEVSAPFGEGKRVQSSALKGAAAVAPAIEPDEPSLIPPNPPRGAVQAVEVAKTSRARPPVSLKAWLAACKAEGCKPIPPDDPVFGYAAEVGIGEDILALHWWQFKRARIAAGKRQRDWRQTFRNSVEGNWYRLWFLKPGQGADLTTPGLQAQALMRAEQRAVAAARGEPPEVRA